MTLWRIKARRNRSLMIGIGILTIFVAAAIFAPVLTPYLPNKRSGIPYMRPSAEHILGTNDIGQDIFSEMLYGARVSLMIGIASAACSITAGMLLGMAGGYFGGWADKAISAAINIMMAMPDLPLTMVLIAFLGGSTLNMILIISLTSWVGTARIVRSKVQQLREQPFVKIELALGAGHMRVMLYHLLPNLWDILLTRFALSVGSAMMLESSLSFLGLGSYGQKSWGNVLHYAFYNGALMNGYYWWYLPPVLCISLCMMGFMLISRYESGREGISRKQRRRFSHAGT